MSKRLLLFPFLLLAGALLGLTGCDDNSSSSDDEASAADVAAAPTNTPDEVESDGADVDLTGEWQRPVAPSIYRLRHTGQSIQGIYYEPNDTNVLGRIAGFVDGDDVEMDIVVTYTDGVRSNFVAHKSGTILSDDHMRLKVTDSPIALGQVQEWYRR
ncbi:MAG TPA: hypothetical protein DCM68_00840 [Verrucomicrobia bacterium]|nr:hypothetical protein [Verrucomicrobiota bacterium]